MICLKKLELGDDNIQLTEENLKGKVFGRWEVVRFSHKSGYNKYFICRCLDCGREKTLFIQNVIREMSKSCGCKSKSETAYKINKKYNKYEEDGDVVKVFIDNNPDKIMLCDIEDWYDLKECYWKDSHGYAVATKDYEYISFHRTILKITDKNIQVDHINGNRLDNRKSNLRLCCNQENSFNKYKNSNNTSGYKGVYYDKERDKWRASIQYNGKSIKSPKRYNTPEEAYKWYIKKSNELFGDFSVFQSRA